MSLKHLLKIVNTKDGELVITNWAKLGYYRKNQLPAINIGDKSSCKQKDDMLLKLKMRRSFFMETETVSKLLRC